VEVGMLVTPQSPLFMIGRLDDVRVEVPVPQDSLAHIKEGHRVEIRTGETAATPIQAEISRISPFLQAGSLSAEAEIDVAEHGARLVPGMFVTVDVFHGESERATLVPTSAIYEEPTSGELGVFVSTVSPAAVQARESGAPDGGLSTDSVDIPFRRIAVVAEGPQTVAVAGIADGEWVVVVGQHLLAAQGKTTPDARIRVVTWDRILELQQRQRDDLLRQFMDKQQRVTPEAS
jgi:multidrug efflux pump subunit AcrA (membrane-fusion protein)